MPELDFRGKEFVRNHHLTVPYRPLIPDPAKSVGDASLDGNLIIHGDNLEALKSLLPKYAGKVDCVFIDPPYNTGNEGWSYNDNVNSPVLKAWFSENPVGIDDGLRHDKWCCMMWPRLKLLHELLAEHGLIWITLDDNEAHRCTLLLDEIFGPDNTVASCVWEKADSPRMDAQSFSSRHDNVLVYAKDISLLHRLRVDRNGEPGQHYRMTDDDGELYYLKPLRAMGGQGELRKARPNLYFALKAPDGSEVLPRLADGTDGTWRWGREKVIKESNRIEWRQVSGAWTPYFRIYARSADGRPPETIFYFSDVGSSRNAKAQLKELFPEGDVFSTPKPIGLVEHVLEISGLLEATDSIVLDSFAGSGTTAHAVQNLNAQDGGNRRFILVECEEYADKLTAERVRRVINGYPFQGTQRETLHEKKLTWTEVKKGEKLREDAEKAKEFAEAEGTWDNVRITVDDGVLKVIGERNVKETAPGLGGSFTYCTLGAPLKLEGLLRGVDLPSREALGAWLLYVAGTGATADTTPSLPEALIAHFLAKQGGIYYWFMYQPDREWLKSQSSALTLDLARAFAAVEPKAEHRVFAPQKFVSNKLLRAEGMRIEFAPIPFALFRRGAE